MNQPPGGQGGGPPYPPYGTPGYPAAPQQGYGQPQQGQPLQGQPPQGYGAPQQGYGAPPQGYGAPPQGYGAPPQAEGYGQPNPYAQPQGIPAPPVALPGPMAPAKTVLTPTPIKDRLRGVGVASLGFALAGFNAWTLYSENKFYVKAMAIAPPLILYGLFQAVAGSPKELQTGQPPMWWRIGMGVCVGVGLLVGIGMVIAIGDW